MHGWPRSAFTARSAAAAITLVAHVIFLLLLLFERRPEPPDEPTSPELTGTWIRLTSFPLPPPAGATTTPQTAEVEPERIAPVVQPPRPTPPTAITLPAPAGPSQAPASQPPAAGIDWHGQAGELAARRAEEMEAPEKTFSPPPVVMRQPCKPPESSLKWKWEASPTGGMAALNAALTLGWEPPPPDSGYFDDMQKDKGAKLDSSVPDPNICD